MSTTPRRSSSPPPRSSDGQRRGDPGTAYDTSIRLSDAEREAAAADLGEHFAQGRLTADEHAERLEQVWAAKTRGEVAPIFRDLPSPYAAVAAPTPTRDDRYWGTGVRPFRRGFPAPFLVVLAVLIACLLHVLPGVVQQNQPWLLFALPIWLVMAWCMRRQQVANVAAA